MSLYPEDVPFTVVSEPWCSYDLGNGCVLRTKLVLIKIIKPPGISLERTREFNFQTNQHTVIDAPVKMKGAPETRQITPQIIEESIIEDIDPKPKNVSSNEYRLKNGTKIHLKLELTRVALTDLYSGDGSPVVAVSHQLVPRIIMPKRKKRKTKSTNIV